MDPGLVKAFVLLFWLDILDKDLHSDIAIFTKADGHVHHQRVVKVLPCSFYQRIVQEVVNIV